MSTITPLKTAEFAGMVPDATTAVVRIYDPNEEWRTDATAQEQAGWGAFLPLSFWDMDPSAMGMLGGALVHLLGAHRETCLALGRRLFGDDDLPWRPFLPADARDVAAFADQLPGKGIRHVLVVCRNGRGRSGALARWLARRLGAELDQLPGADPRASEFICRTLDRAA
ncbi:MAG: hypothetical protein ACM31L_03735 [Actinomycetota bacterium]